MAKCRKCGRHLKNPKWAALGIGPVCAKKEKIANLKNDNGDGDIIVPYDGGDIWIERLASPTYGNDGELKIAVHTCSGIKTNVQRSIYRHSPTGFNFGYGGSGPADLALNICRMFTDEKTADNIYKDFKWKFCGQGDSKLVIPKTEIISFIESKKKGLQNLF